MSAIALAIGFVLAVWWFGTGVVLYLDGLPRRTFAWTMGGGAGVATAALYGLAASSASATPAGAYCAFACALALWAVVEISQYLGFLTGVHRMPCPPGCGGPRRFALALGASIHHELAAVGMAAIVHALTAGGVNRVGIWTFGVLLLARWSAKLNLFLGVPNFHREWLPEHLRYVASYVRKRPMNLLFPVSVTLMTAALALALARLAGADAGSFEQVGTVLVATLIALALIEHWFLVLPVQDSALWRWALTERAAGRRLEPLEAASAVEVAGRRIERPAADA